MCLISVPNLNKIDPREGHLWLAQRYCLKWFKEEEKDEENGAIFRNTYLTNYWANFLQIWYVE